VSFEVTLFTQQQQAQANRWLRFAPCRKL